MFETERLPDFVGRLHAQAGVPLPRADLSGGPGLVTEVALAALAALECLDVAVLLIGAELTILHANRAAAAVLAVGDGFRVTSSRLVCNRADDTAKLLRLVGPGATPAWQGIGAVIEVGRESGRRRFSVSVLLLGASAPASMRDFPKAVLFVNDPEMARAVSLAQMQRLYGLSTAEARTAAALMDHKPLAEVGRKLGVSLATVRTLLQRAFEKTETHSQAELVHLMLAHRLPTAPEPDAILAPASLSRTSVPP